MYIPLLLANTRMNCSAREVALAEKLVKLSAAQGGAHKDNDLVELERVKKIVELAVLLTLVELHVELLQTVQGKFLLVIHVNLQRRLHELLAHSTDILRKSGGEHHHLLMSRCCAEDGLYIVSHV
jgi:hypothetical protein